MLNKYGKKSLAVTLFIVCAALLDGCGGSNPAPPPMPTNPNPTPGYGGYGYGVSCGGMPGGVPLNPSNTPYLGNFTNGQSGSVQLNAFFVNDADAGSSTRSVVGSGSFTINTQSNYQGQGNTAITGCVTSSSQTGTSPGLYS